MQPETRYAKSGDVSIAYQVFGEGSINLVLSPFFISNIEHFWEDPDMSRWLARLGGFARVAMFDKCGTGQRNGGRLKACPAIFNPLAPGFRSLRLRTWVIVLFHAFNNSKIPHGTIAKCP